MKITFQIIILTVALITAYSMVSAIAGYNVKLHNAFEVTK